MENQLLEFASTLKKCNYGCQYLKNNNSDEDAKTKYSIVLSNLADLHQQVKKTLQENNETVTISDLVGSVFNNTELGLSSGTLLTTAEESARQFIESSYNEANLMKKFQTFYLRACISNKNYTHKNERKEAKILPLFANAFKLKNK